MVVQVAVVQTQLVKQVLTDRQLALVVPANNGLLTVHTTQAAVAAVQHKVVLTLVQVVLVVSVAEAMVVMITQVLQEVKTEQQTLVAAEAVVAKVVQALTAAQV
jgi:hypothetical protein